MNVLQVSELNEQIKSLLESHFQVLYVEGEVSRPTYHTSGHLYFSLKDSESVIRCVMFRSNLQRVPFRVEDGQKLIVTGKIGVYKPRGEYQLYALELHPAGEGALQLAYEQLKKKLQAKGYFENKKPIPQIVRSIAIVTSRTGAALQDMLRIINKRWPLVKVYVVDSLVQGKAAARELAQRIQVADSLGADVMIVGRGGGSIEDLWCFNEEVVAEAIYAAKTPVVSAVGHEIDFVISDFVADLRAPTPSAAIEMILPDRAEMLLHIDTLMDRFTKRIASIVHTKEQTVRHMAQSLAHLSPQRRLESLRLEIASTKQALGQRIALALQHKEATLPQLKGELTSVMRQRLQRESSELALLAQKFTTAIKAKEPPKGSAQVVRDGKPTELAQLAVGDVIELQDLQTKVAAKVLKKDAL